MNASDKYTHRIQVCQRQTTTGRHAIYFRRHEIHTLFDELIHRPWGRSQWNPPVDIHEDDDAFVIEADLPGVNAEDVRIRIEGRTLAIEGRRQLRPCDNSRTSHLCERPDGGFIRVFEFQENIEQEQIQTRWQDGVLMVTVLKTTKE